MIKRLMKGAAIDDLSQVQFPVYAGPKVDGFRCWLGDRPLTSRMGPYRNPFVNSELSGLLSGDQPLDGELVVGDKRGTNVLSRTSSGLTNGKGKPDITLWVFDAPDLVTPYEDRYPRARQMVGELGHPRVKMLKHHLFLDLASLEAYASRCLARRYEGIMLRSPTGLFKEGKSTIRQQWLLKFKPFEDAEGRVVGYFEEMENTNEAKREEATGKLKRSSAKAGKKGKGTLGGLILEDCVTKKEVRVGGGFTKLQRERLWEIRETLHGKLVRYKKQKVGEKDKPRHPNFVEFVDFRPEWDMTDD